MNTCNAPLGSPVAGSGTNAAELLAIGGDQANVFEVADFDLLNGKPRVGKYYCSNGIGFESRRNKGF